VPTERVEITRARQEVALNPDGVVVTGVTSVIARARNEFRHHLYLINDSVNIIYLSKSDTAVSGQGIVLVDRGSTFECGTDTDDPYTGPIAAIASAAASNLVFSEA